MDFSSITLFSMLKTKMSYLQQRQDLLSQNVANIDTPGFEPHDLKKLDFKRMSQAAQQRIAMRLTSPQHIASRPIGGGPFKEIVRNPTYETSPNKNAASAEEEMMKVAQNGMDYQLATDIYKKTVDLFKIAIGKSGG